MMTSDLTMFGIIGCWLMMTLTIQNVPTHYGEILASKCPLPKDFPVCHCDGQIQLNPLALEPKESSTLYGEFYYQKRPESQLTLVVCQYLPLNKILSEFRKSKIPLDSIPALTVRYSDIEYVRGDPFLKMKIRALHLNNNKIRNLSTDSFLAISPSLELLDLRINRLKQVPTHALSQLSRLTTLDLAYNSIGIIGIGAFAGLKSLTRLHLESNEITNIAPGALAGFGDSLLELELQNNQVKTIPVEAFADLKSLKKLDMARNVIEMLPRHSFTSLTSLESLNLGHNHIRAIEGTAFQGLEGVLRVLFLHNNQLERVHSENFKYLSSVEYLVLGANSIRHIPDNCFDGMKALRTLNLENNKITTISDDSFMGLENSLTYLHLPGNLISAVPNRAIRNLKNLWVFNLGENVIHDLSIHDFTNSSLKKVLGTLYLNGNLLVRVPTEALAGFEALWLLDLSNNEIQVVRNASFRTLTSLEILNLEGNKIRSLDGSAFVGLEPTIKKISLNGNAFVHLPLTPFVPLQNLRSLDFEGNKIGVLESVDTYGFGTMASDIRTLGLSGNVIGSIGQGSFSNTKPSLVNIDLSHNKLRRLVSSTFVNSGNIKNINLSHNLLETMERDTFVNMISVSHLNLSHNHLKEIHPHMFKGVSYLTHLDLSHNILTALPSLAFKFVSELELLDLSDNNISFVSAHALAGLYRMRDFRMANNKLFTMDYGSFNRFTFNSLNNVDLRNNPWICDCRLRWLREWMAELMNFKKRSSSTSKMTSLQNVVCYGPHHLMNSCLLCIPPEAYVCPDPEKYSGLILLPGPRTRLGAKNEQFSWITRARREKWTRGLIILLATLLGLCIAVIAALSILICRNRTRKSNARTRLSGKMASLRGGGDHENVASRLHDSSSKAKLLNTTDSLNMGGTSDIRGIGNRNANRASGRRFSDTSNIDNLDYIDNALPQQNCDYRNYTLEVSDAGSSNEFLRALEIGEIVKRRYVTGDGRGNMEIKSPLYENITQRSKDSQSFHQYSVPNLACASASSIHFGNCGTERNGNVKLVKHSHKNSFEPQASLYKQYSKVSQEDPDIIKSKFLNGGTSSSGAPLTSHKSDGESDQKRAQTQTNDRKSGYPIGNKITIVTNDPMEKLRSTSRFSISHDPPNLDDIKNLKTNFKGDTIELIDQTGDGLGKDLFLRSSIRSDTLDSNDSRHGNVSQVSNVSNSHFDNYIYPELYPLPPSHFDQTGAVNVDGINTEKISV